MEDLELMRFVTIGQYLPTGSWLHRLDPRTKILGLGALIVLIVASSGVGRQFVELAFVLGLVLLARVPLGFALGGLRPAVPFLLLIAVLQLLFGWGVGGVGSCVTLWSVWLIKLSTCSVLAVLTMLFRLISLFLLTGLLTMTATISELTHGIENLLRPLKRIGFPAHELSMVFTIALRFVPTLVEELEKLLKAQAARGADIRLGSNPVQRTRQFLPILAPLFLTTLRRSEILIEAMEARGYASSARRSHYVQLDMTVTDAVALVWVVVMVIGFICVPFGAVDAWLIMRLARLAGF